MSEPNIREIAEREKAATPGPWDGSGGCITNWNGDNCTYEMEFVSNSGGNYQNEDADISFIAHARTDIPALLQEIRRLTASRCRCFYGGYQPVPIRCGLNVHTGQHAGIGDNGAAVIWPEQSSDISGQLRASEAVREHQGREIAGLRNALDHIASSEDMGLAYARRIARRALTHVTCPDCDGAGVLNAGPGGHDHCDRCGTTGRIRINDPVNLP